MGANEKTNIPENSTEFPLILVAAGTDLMRRLFARILRSLGNVRVLFASTPQEMIDIARKHKPRGILLDLEEDRLKVIEAIKIHLRFPQTQAMPLLLFAQETDRVFIEQCKNEGAALVVTKPYRRAGLETILKKFLSLESLPQIAETTPKEVSSEIPKANRSKRSPLLVKKIGCPFHDEPFFFDGYFFKTGSLITENNPFDILSYKEAAPNYDYCNYLLQEVQVCPECHFASSNPADWRTHNPEDAALDFDAKAIRAIQQNKKERQDLFREGSPTFFSDHRTSRDAAVAINLAILSAQALYKTAPHEHTPLLCRIGKYYLWMAEVLRLSGHQGPEERQLRSALTIFLEAFPHLDGFLLIRTLYQIVALCIHFGDDMQAVSYLTRLKKYAAEFLGGEKNATQEKFSGKVHYYLQQAQILWEDRDNHRRILNKDKDKEKTA